MAVDMGKDTTKEIEKAKTDFVSLASHQLRTPLSSIRWYGEMLLAGDGGKLTKGQKQFVEEIYQSAERMVDLVNDLLDTSRLELGTFVIEEEPTDIVALAKRVVNEQKHKIAEGKIKFSAVFAPNLPLIRIDPKVLWMILENLVSNAIKYTPKGRVALEISKKEGSIFIKVSDTGYGIPQPQQHLIFTKFFRADNVRTKEIGGTGLGLYLVKYLVEFFKGKTWFESQENKGTTFYVTLPLKRIL